MSGQADLISRTKKDLETNVFDGEKLQRTSLRPTLVVLVAQSWKQDVQALVDTASGHVSCISDSSKGPSVSWLPIEAKLSLG